jgi:hypothetical protein
MTIQEKATATPVFHNVLVTAMPALNPDTGKVEYTTTFTPEVVFVTTQDAVLNYQLVSPTPTGVQFKEVKFKQKIDQLSQPSISISGKNVTFNDANTSPESINATFHFADSDGVLFSVDPIIENDPEPPMSRKP